MSIKKYRLYISKGKKAINNTNNHNVKGVENIKTLKQWLETNYNKHKEAEPGAVINVFDVEYMQGVLINVGSPLENILNDRPVVKFLDYVIVSVEVGEHKTDDNKSIIEIGVTKP